MKTPTVIEYDKYTLRAGMMSGVWTARAFYKSPSRTKGIVMEVTGESEEAVLIDLKNKLDELRARLLAARRRDEAMKFDVPSCEEYAMALQLTQFSDAQLAMLKAHAAAGDSGMTAGELASAGGYADFSSANLHYGKCGRAIAETLSIVPPESNLRDSDVPTVVLAAAGEARPKGEFVWVMYPELRRAIEAILP